MLKLTYMRSGRKKPFPKVTLEEEIADETILLDIAKVKIEDLRNEIYANDTIKSVVKNIKKPKNLFMYYPYEYVLENNAE